MVKLDFIKNLINDPEKTIKPIQSNYNIWKTLLLFICYSILGCFNFWSANFIISYNVDLMLILIFIILGFISAGYFIINYLIYLVIFLRLFSDNKSTKHAWSNTKTILWYYLIPSILFHLILFCVNLILANIHLNYIFVYLYDNAKFILYAWVLSLSLYFIIHQEKNHKFKHMLLVLIPFLISYILMLIGNYLIVIYLFSVLI
ncbi:MAG: hypothetical protein ACTSPY_17715 [Candidatus Helarchaeota archaeon]